MANTLTRFLALLGLGVTRSQTLSDLHTQSGDLIRLRRFAIFAPEIVASSEQNGSWEKALEEIAKSTSQLQQDLVVLLMNNFKKEGFFVEFGATDGISLSNTYLLEKFFDWHGILAEPAKKWHKSLYRNRKAIIETSCVWSKSNEKLEFLETKVAELSTLKQFRAGDMHAESRNSRNLYLVNTVSLQDMLDRNSAPKYIDYISIDTEGSEFEILETFDFNKYQFGFISCEHNFTPNRELVHSLLKRHGYVRILERMSWFDDWYLPRELAKSKGFI